MINICKPISMGMGILTLLTGGSVLPAQTPSQVASPVPGVAENHLSSAPEPAKSEPDKMAVRSLALYFTRATDIPNSPSAEGFLQRWLLLEPIVKPNRTNAVFTGTYVRNTFNTEYFPDQFTVVPRDGDKVTVNGEELAWHALDTSSFNVKLFRFAYGLNRPTYGVIFWVVGIIDSPREIENIRMTAGSNSASMWWLNGKEVVHLFDDRRMVMDDAVSAPLTLKKGRNIIRGVIINGPGLSDFCVRFIDEKDKPVRDFSMSAR